MIHEIEAIMADKKYIAKYAIFSFGEDAAETISFWVAVRCSDKSKRIKKRIIKSIPNRIKALDKFIKDNELKTFPMVCDKKLNNLYKSGVPTKEEFEKA